MNFVIFVRMNKKLTISIDDTTIERAKNYAKSKGQSLSEIIENYLKLISSKTEKPKVSTQVSKLKGAVRFSQESDYKKMLEDSISEKYLK
jgi:macrodomain Ter protein organizer (MatP/YcbG family)